jgi:hypothetical protein
MSKGNKKRRRRKNIFNKKICPGHNVIKLFSLIQKLVQLLFTAGSQLCSSRTFVVDTWSGATESTLYW